MSNNSIRETVDTIVREQVGSVPMGYERVVEAVKVAMEGLAEQAADSIRESADNAGLDGEQVEAALVSAGLVEPEPVVEETVAAEGSDIEARVSKIESAIERLTGLAESAQRRFGF